MQKRCCIITAYVHGEYRDFAALLEGSFVICADGGRAIAERWGARRDLCIADMDSSSGPDPNILLPSEKDDTDTLACLKYATDLGYADISIIGGIGGRMDHTYANIQCLAWALRRGIRAELVDARHSARIVGPGEYALPAERRFVSLFAYTPEAEISISGVKYPLNRHILSSAMPLGVSNEVTSPGARAEVLSGEVLIIFADE